MASVLGVGEYGRAVRIPDIANQLHAIHAMIVAAAARRRSRFVWRTRFPRARCIDEDRMRTYVRMTSQGSAYGRFRRALQQGNLQLVRASAGELPTIRLDDALRVCLLIRDRDPQRYERAALRWVARFAVEAQAATLGDVQAAARALAQLPSEPDDAMGQLQRLCLAHQLGA
jgi:hypothetical protein